MRITLVSTYTHPIALGLRYVSSYLKAAGHNVEVIFMSSRRDTTEADFSAAALENLVERVRDRELIGLSLMTNSFHRAGVLTQHIRAAGIKTPIIWGGTHPTVAAEESLEIADVICIGEGEEALLQFVERLEAGRDPTDIASLWFRGGGPFGNRAAIRNPYAPLATDLDGFPFPDYELETHWVAGKHGLVPARPENLRGTLHTLRVLSSRGCPYRCTFCNNAGLRKLFEGRGQWLRLRSVDNVLGEIRLARSCFPTIQAVNLVDDLFFVRDEEEIDEFARKYNEHVGLPLQMDAFPNTVSDRKVRALAKVPIELISMGIESASEDTLNNVYQRPTPPKRIAEAIATLKKHRVRTEYHYIVSNPFEPDRNVTETMRFIADHHRGPAVLRVFPLMFYPGTPLYDRARAEGLIGARDTGAYDYMGTGALDFARHDYLAVWLRTVLKLRNIGVPSWLAHRVIDFATNRVARKVLDRKWFCPTVYYGYFVTRKLVRNFIYQPFIRPFKYLRRRPRRPQTAEPTARWTVPQVDLSAHRQGVLKQAAASLAEAASTTPASARVAKPG
jgi:anaerobic magnesium-protoporphyrin IX monomethyl ester cyclase